MLPYQKPLSTSVSSRFIIHQFTTEKIEFDFGILHHLSISEDSFEQKDKQGRTSSVQPTTTTAVASQADLDSASESSVCCAPGCNTPSATRECIGNAYYTISITSSCPITSSCYTCPPSSGVSYSRPQPSIFSEILSTSRSSL